MTCHTTTTSFYTLHYYNIKNLILKNKIKTMPSCHNSTSYNKNQATHNLVF